MRMRDALTGFINSLGWEAESDNPTELVSQLSRMLEVEDGAISVKESPEYACKIGKVGYTSVADAIADARGRTVRLLRDMTEGVTVPEGTTLTLHLNGHSIVTAGCAVDNYGTLTVRGGTVESTSSFAIHSGSGARTSIERCVVRSVEGAVITGKSRGTTISISGCEMSASDNAVVAGNGSEGFGGNTVTITNSTLVGRTKSSGYIGCGIYCPTDDEFSVRDCAISVETGCGILSRAGKVTVRDTSITTTGDVTGKVGDSRVVVPCAALVFDEEANYPSLSADDKVKAVSCALRSDVDPAATIGEGMRIEVM